MSGVAKDDTNPGVPSDDTVSAVGDAEAGQAESTDASEPETRAGRRVAPHLRVVTDDDAGFIPPAPAMEQNQRIGQLIRATRENLGYTLDQVSKETRVHLSHLRAIEDMTPNLLGAPVYAKGYIKAYARYLGLDEQTTLERYLKECAILKDPEKKTIAPPATGRKLPAAVPVFGFLIVALIAGAGGFFLFGGEKTSVASSDTPPAAGEAAPAASSILASPAPAVTQQLRVVALKPAKIEIRSAAGDKMVNREFAPGEPFLVRVGAGWTVSTEDGSAFEWRLGDQSLGLLAPEGPVYSQSVDLAAQRPPIVVETPPDLIIADPAAEDSAQTDSGAPAANPSASAPPARASGAAATARPSASRSGSGSGTAAPPRVAAAQPRVAAAPPPVEAPPPVQPAVTPQQDPALLAYPGLPPPQPQPQ